MEISSDQVFLVQQTNYYTFLYRIWFGPHYIISVDNARRQAYLSSISIPNPCKVFVQARGHHTYVKIISLFPLNVRTLSPFNGSNDCLTLDYVYSSFYFYSALYVL